MRIYPLAPDAEEVRSHFVDMAKNGVKPVARRRVGWGFAGTRLKLGGRSILRGSGPGTGKRPVAMQPMVPAEVGVQQARLEVTTPEIHREAAAVREKKTSDETRGGGPIKKGGKRSVRQSAAGKDGVQKKKRRSATVSRRHSDNFS